MYSLIRVWIGAKLARMLIQVSVVVRTTRASESPSTPSLYWMPKAGIQSAVSTSWKPARAAVEARRRESDTTHVASAVASASSRAQRSRREADDDAPRRAAGT